MATATTGLATGIVGRSRVVIVALLLVTAAFGAGVPALEMADGGLGADSDEMAAYEYAGSAFGGDDEPTTMLVVHDDDALAAESLDEQLRVQQAIVANETVGETLRTNDSVLGVGNAVAIAAILEDRRAHVDATAAELSDALEETREYQARLDGIDRREATGDIDADTAEQRRAETLSDLERVRDEATANLTAEEAAGFDELAADVREIQREASALEAAYADGEIDSETYQDGVADLEREFEATHERIYADVLGDEIERLETQRDAIRGTHADRTDAADAGVLPTLAEQRDRLTAMEGSEIDATLDRLLADEGTASAVDPFLPADYGNEGGGTDATLIVVTHDGDATDDRLVAAHDAIDALAAAELSNEPTVYSQARADHETGQSTGDSLLLLGPPMLALILVSLGLAYRDPLDVALGLAGVVVVLIWTVGIMGWAGIEFHFLFVAIPMLLVGLAIDFAIHLVMRYREALGDESATYEGRGLEGEPGAIEGRTPEGEPPTEAVTAGVRVRRAMGVGLAGVLGAFLWVAATTSTGFLSNLVSTSPQIRQFGIVAAIGIASTCAVFATLIPAAKVELDAWLATRGYPREKRAFGTTGVLRRLLESAASVATAAPKVVLVVVLLVSLVGAYGVTHVDTASERTMFAPEEPAAWMDRLPEPFAPGEYSQREAMVVVDDRFARGGTDGWILIRGDVTDPAVLEGVQRSHDRAGERDRVEALESPLSAMAAVAAENESFERTYDAADTTGDDVPDSNLTAVYEAFSATAPDRADDVLSRTDDGDYEAMRVIVTVEPGASDAAISEEARAVAIAAENGEYSVTATGRPVAAHTNQTDSRDAAIESMTVTIVVVFALLSVGYRRLHGTWSLGSVTLFPMVLLLTWVFGTMALLEVPLNALTAVIASFTVALGVDYCIHLSERFHEELQRAGTIDDAVRRSVVGTGGALAGSALTTATGFGILALAISPALEQFGIVMGITIVYAFLASVLVLPSLLVLWARTTGYGR